jgi:hypothetical protein
MVLIERACKPLNFLGWRTVGGWGAISIWVRRSHGHTPTVVSHFRIFLNHFK